MECDARLRELARRIQNIQDIPMRAGYLRTTLLQMDIADVAELFVLAVSGTEAGEPTHGNLLQFMSLALADERCADLREAIRRTLLAGDQPSIAALLTPPTEKPLEEQAMQVPDFGLGRPLTLGERKSVARRRDRDLIARVVRDPHPEVIRILLLNPGVVEQDVIRLVTRRPVAPDVLREVFACPRWIVRYTVKLAITLNPYAPLDVRLQLVPHLSPQDAERVLETPRLPLALEAACTRMTARGQLH